METARQHDSFLAQLRSDGVVRSEHAILTPLSGGVSSEIYRVDRDGAPFVVKRALGKLRVAEEWRADVSRNVQEQRYLSYVSRLLPGSVPVLRAAMPDSGYFAMEYLDSRYRNWKQLLLDGHFDPATAAAAGNTLGRIHRLSSGDRHVRSLFDNPSSFYQLRLEPYLLTTGQRHPQLRSWFEAEVERLQNTAECVIHGDFSPKNILIGENRMVILDCEAACYGDPAFDVAFFLTHLFLKSLLHLRTTALRGMIDSFSRQYTSSSGFAVENRVPRLLLMLLLARIDGKSPVEYLQDESRKQFVRDFVYDHACRRDLTLAELSKAWFDGLSVL